MFDLEHEIDAWSKKAYDGPCRGKAASLDELRDHLHCEIERLEAAGKPREEAFRIATTKLVEAPGRATQSRACRAFDRGRIGNAIVWAAVMIATSLVLVKDGSRDKAAYMLTIVLVPAWIISDQIVTRQVRATGDH